MLDKEYFDKFLLAQVEELGSGCCGVSVVLMDGAEYRLVKSPRAEAGYVMMEVFPQEGVNEESRAKRRLPYAYDEDKDKVYWDRLVVPYDCIQRVLITVMEPENGKVVGFNS